MCCVCVFLFRFIVYARESMKRLRKTMKDEVAHEMMGASGNIIKIKN